MRSPAALAPVGRGAAAGPRRRFRVPSIVFGLYALLLGFGLGAGSAYWIVNADYPFGRVRAGPWTAWPRAGSRDADPYMRAIVARQGDLPLGLGEGLALTATEDSAGQPLEARCRYSLGAATPPARSWTLALYDAEGRPLRSDWGWSGLTSAEIVRDREGRFAVTLARDASPGNWIRMPEGGRVSLTLRLYDTPVAGGSAALDPALFPSIERLGCEG